jgi:hypothetical protein
MTKLPATALTTLLLAAGLAVPAFAATPQTGAAQVPSCPTGTSVDYDAQMATLSSELDLAFKPGSSIDEWSGCIKVTTVDGGVTTMSFYDPDSLRLVAEI